MTNDALLSVMKNNHVEVDKATDPNDVYVFEVDHHRLGYLDKYGNLFLNTFSETVSRPLSIGQQVISRWVKWAAEGLRINIRRLEKWQ